MRENGRTKVEQGILRIFLPLLQLIVSYNKFQMARNLLS